MRVAHVFKDFYPPTTGGVEQHMAVLCEGLARKIEVTVLVPSRSSRRVEERLGAVQVIRVPEFGRYLSTPLCPTMPAELRRLAPDLVHLHFPNPTGDLAYLLSGRRTPVVLSYHADIVRQRRVLWLYRPVFERLARRVGRMIVSSPNYLRSSPFLPRYRHLCDTVPYGIDIGPFLLRDGEARSVKDVRERWGDRLVLFLGVLRYYKGLDVLLQAMPEVSGRLLIVGRGEHGQLERLARALGVADRVAFLGEVSTQLRRVLLHAADVLVLPSTDRSEAFGIVQLEAMACGTPVVASDLPTGIRLVNRHGETGLLVPPGDAYSLAGALNDVLGDDALKKRLGGAGRDRVEREFTAEAMVRRTLEIYEDVLA